MALKQHHLRSDIFGLQQVRDFQIDGDTSYVTNGYLLPTTLAQMGISNVVRVEISPTAKNEAYVWDYANQKVIFTDGAGTEAVNGTDQSARKNIRVRVYGSAEVPGP